MIVCVCNNVSTGDIAVEAANGCGSFETLQDRTLVGTCCGACLPCARETFDEHSGSVGAANRHGKGSGRRG